MTNEISINQKNSDDVSYSTREILNLTGLKKAQFFHIIKYLGLIIPTKKLGTREFYSFTSSNLNDINTFIKEHNNITQFFKEQTYLEHFGVLNPSQCEEIKNKKKQTCLKHFGVENNLKSQDTKDKIKQTCLEKYGTEYALQSEKVRLKIKNTCLEHYGVENPNQSEIVKDKIKKTCLEKYGTESAIQSKEVRNKIQNTIKNKYGVDCYFQTDEFKNKFKESCLEHYGVEHPMYTENVKDKIKQTCLEKYGVDNPGKSKDIKNKSIETSKNNVLNIEKEYDYTQVNKLIDKYGQGWYVYLNIPKIKIKGNSYVSNTYLEQIKNYSENSIGGISYEEKDVVNFIKDIYLGEIIENDRTTISPLELDIYIPEKKLAIEFNGSYWHSQEHNSPKKYHENKSKLCEEKGIRLIHIYECEWNFQQEKIKSLLRLALGVGYSKVGARKCEVRKITNKEAKQFNDDNHLQNHRNASVTYGLYYNNELQQLMSFSHHSKYEWEIIRGCPGSNNQVVGGVSKLFKAFIKEYNPNSVFSYCDFNKFDGKGYEALGMKFIGYTGPDKFYVDKSGVKMPRNPKKRKELEESCLYTIFGAGSKKYLWSNINK